jgi:pyrroline-5-carboxylate reductase
MVSSKGGTTIAGLSAFADHNLQAAVADCCARCTKRAEELAK